MRYAIYYAPRPTDPLHDVASRWLGRDALHGTGRDQPSPVPGISLGALTREPRRYGFHATLKPPFALAEGRQVPELRAAVEALTRSAAPIALPPLQIRRLGSFYALAATGAVPAVDDLAARCVAELDAFRAPATVAEMMRRRSTDLTDRQDRILQRWGYPYVMAEYRFHMTLTGGIDDDVVPALEQALDAHFRDVLATPLVLDSLSIFVEPAAGESFIFLARIPLIGDRVLESAAGGTAGNSA